MVIKKGTNHIILENHNFPLRIHSQNNYRINHFCYLYLMKKKKKTKLANIFIIQIVPFCVNMAEIYLKWSKLLSKVWEKVYKNPLSNIPVYHGKKMQTDICI